MQPSAMNSRAMMPAWGQWRRHCNEGNNAFADQGQQCHIVTRATIPSWQWQGWLCINNGDNAVIIREKNAIATTAKILRIDGNTIATWDDTSSTTSSKGNFASWTTTKTRLHISNGNDAIVMRATIAIAIMAKKPAHGWWQCQLADKQWGQWHWWWRWCHCNEGNDASLTMATTQSWQGQQHHRRSRATTPLLQERQHHLDNSKDACALTTAITPLLWGQQLQWQQWQRRLRI